MTNSANEIIKAVINQLSNTLLPNTFEPLSHSGLLIVVHFLQALTYTVNKFCRLGHVEKDQIANSNRIGCIHIKFICLERVQNISIRSIQSYDDCVVYIQILADGIRGAEQTLIQ